jgi:hypothetical protein
MGGANDAAGSRHLHHDAEADEHREQRGDVQGRERQAAQPAAARECARGLTRPPV